MASDRCEQLSYSCPFPRLAVPEAQHSERVDRIGQGPLNLVLFDDAVEHFCRIMRVCGEPAAFAGPRALPVEITALVDTWLGNQYKPSNIQSSQAR